MLLFVFVQILDRPYPAEMLRAKVRYHACTMYVSCSTVTVESQNSVNVCH